MSDSLRPLDCSLPGSSVHGIFQARVLEWVAISFSNRLYGRVSDGSVNDDLQESTSQDCCCQCLCPHSEPFLVHASTGDPPTLAGRSGSVSCGVTAPFLCSLCAQEFLCAIQEWNLYLPQSCESSVIKYHWLLMSDFLEIPSPLTRSPGCEA